MTATASDLLALALTGEDLVLPGGLDAPSAVLAGLAGLGWPPTRLRAYAASRRDAGLPWPLPVPGERLRQVGPAQWYAALRAVCAALAVDVQPVRPSRRTTLTPDERRLIAEAPPHHGLVG
jgi:hypothetical protein